MTELRSSHFGEFYKAAHERSPFPWQERLAEEVLTRGWPDVLNLPTGAGKTSVLDVALFSLAAAPDRFPRRIVFVVDRRVVVDQAAEHAAHLMNRLCESGSGILEHVAQRLRACWEGSENEAPFVTSVLRGGMPRDDAWARRPDQPVIAVSTVDQVGSRLLFRGYGVKANMAPVHAGLLGCDTLFLLDEVHLSVPFFETLMGVNRWRRQSSAKRESASAEPHQLPDRWQVVRLSATAALRPDDRVFQLQPADRENEKLDRRLRASKVVRLVPVKVKGNSEAQHRARMAQQALEEALRFVDTGASAVAVVVNRVDTARIVRRELDRHLDRLDAVLLTGRMRPLDREAILDKSLLDRIASGRERSTSKKPLVVVATQCIEAGADFDFDALVTECASLDALRQRFGRLNRLGDLAQTHAVILCRTDLGEGTISDPVYGPALSRTWKWLTEQGDAVDFGVDHLKLPPDGVLQTLVAPAERAPLLLPSHVDRWSQTSPVPAPDPDVSSWLHGSKPQRPEVQLVWRADVTQEQLESIADEERARSEEELSAILSACPPSALEALSLPIHAARWWLKAGGAVDIADVEGGGLDGESEGESKLVTPRRAFRWAGDDSAIVDPDQIRPGDTLVVPSSYGGLTDGNWDPESLTGWVTDLGDLANWRHRGRAVLRLHPDVLRTLGQLVPGGLEDPANVAILTVLERPPTVPQGESDEESDPDTEIADWLKSFREALPLPVHEDWAGLLEAISRLGKKSRPSARRLAMPNNRWTLLARHRARQVSRPSQGMAESSAGDVTTEGEDGSFTGREITLREHSNDVRGWAERFTRALRLPEALANDIALAAWLHDVGKADPRFQCMLLGGSAVRLAHLQAPLAKSAVVAHDAAARRFARQAAGYPEGYRHEILSVAMLQRHPDVFARCSDVDLVLHLVGSHHGWCRPFAPLANDENSIHVSLEDFEGLTLTADTAHGLARIDSGVAERFWRLQWRYGWWGLAWLEAIVRLADHRASEEEEEREVTG